MSIIGWGLLIGGVGIVQRGDTMNIKYVCQQCGGEAVIRGQQAISQYENPYIAEYVICEDCGYTVSKAEIDSMELLQVIKCAEADLYDFVTNWMDLDIKTATVPAAQSWRELLQ